MAYNVSVTSGSPSLPKGQYRVEIHADAIQLSKRKDPAISIPVGTPAKYREKNRLALKLQDGQVELSVNKLASYQNRLARNLASFLNQQQPAPVLSDYSLPWYFWVIAVLPLGIPVVCLGGAIPAMIGAGFAAGCFAIARNEEWPEWVRVLLSLALVALAYTLFFVAAIILVMLQAGRQ